VGDGGWLLHRILVSAAVAAVLAITAAAAAEQDDAVGLDLGGVGLLAFLLPLAGRQAAFDEDLLALDEIGLKRLGLLAPQHDAMPFGLLVLLAVLARPVLRRGNAEARHGGAARCVTHFGIPSEVAHQ